jgi:membrane associated rhomboid family serine protease
MSDPSLPEETPGEPVRTRVAVSPPRDEPTVFERLRAAPVTFALVALNAAAFLWVETHGGTSSEASLVRFGAIDPLLFWAGEYWRVVTYMFLHAGWMHILMNMYVLIGWGAALERAIGKKRFFVLYMVAGIGGGCMSIASGLLFTPHTSVGASGALFGIVGAILALRRRQLPSFQAFFADRAIRSTLLQIGLWTAIGSVALNLDNACHLGGFVFGFAAFWLYTSPVARYGWLALGAAMGALFILAARPTWSPTGRDEARISIYARSYLTGTNPYGGAEPWPVEIARGKRLAQKGCDHGVAGA